MNSTSRIRRSFLHPLLLPLLLACAFGGCAYKDTRSYQVGETKIRCLDGSGVRKTCTSLKELSLTEQWFIESAIADAREKQHSKVTSETLQPHESAEFVEASDRFKKYEIPKEIKGGPAFWLDNDRIVFASRAHNGWKAKKLEPSRIVSYNVVTGELVDSGYRGQVNCLNHLGDILIDQVDNEESSYRLNERRWFYGKWGQPLQRTEYVENWPFLPYLCDFNVLRNPAYRSTPGPIRKDSIRYTPLLPQHGVLKETDFADDGSDINKIYLLKPDGQGALIATKQLSHFQFTYLPWSDAYFEVEVLPDEPRTFSPSGVVVRHSIPKLLQYWRKTIYSSIAAYPSRHGIVWAVQQKTGFWRKQGLFLQPEKGLLRIDQGQPSGTLQTSPDGCKISEQILRGDPYGSDWRNYIQVVIDLCKENDK